MSCASFELPRPRRVAGALGALFLLALAGCEIVSVSGPSTGTVGQVLTYDVVVRHPIAATQTDATIWLMVEFPSAWSVAGATYAGSVDGNLVGGTPDRGPPTAVDLTPCFGGDPAPGYQHVYFSAGPFPQLVQDDQGTLTVGLATAGPPGNYTLRFRAATEIGAEGARGLACEYDPKVRPPVTVSYDVSLTSSILPIPALGSWGVALLALLLVGFGLRRLASAA